MSMHKYELNYDFKNVPQTKTGEVAERADAHKLLMEVLGLGEGGQIIGSTSLEHSLRLMQLTNVSVTWL